MNRTMRARAGGGLALLLLPLAPAASAQAAASPQASAQTAPAPQAAPAPAFAARARELVAILSGSGDYATFFSKAVRDKVPEAQIQTVSAQLAAANGPVVGVDAIDVTEPYSGNVEVAFRDSIVTFRMVVDPEAPHQVSGLLVQGMRAREKTLDDVTAALRGLHGTTGYALARLGSAAPVLIEAHNADTPFAIGSAFKLVILAEIVRAIQAGERHWDDKVVLDGRQLPGGGYTSAPKGTEVPLRELAAKMISVSDNSATDILLRTLGREKVEAMLPVVGVADPAANRPFLGTLEAFKLKYLDGGSYGRRYAALDTAGRRRLLDEIAAIPLVALPPAPEGGRKPAMIQEIEWFLTPADLVRILDWLRRNTEGPQGAEVRAILSRNPGVDAGTASRWRWVGYKGGSEPGVMNMALLLEAKNGEWQVLTGSWNDPAEAVNEARFASLIGRAAALAAP